MTFRCIRCKSDIDPKFKACPFCGEAVTDFLRMHHDTPVDGKYQIVSCLGAGGMGEVYKVLHIHLNSMRVIKLMRANIAEDPGANERFIREARLATKIHHPSVATLFDFSTLADGSRYMVWEYIEGKNLHQLVHDRGPLSPRHAASIAYEALLGLEAVHRAGIIHRDISPENIMVSVDDEGEEHVKIIDLGIAKQWGDEGHQTTTGVFVGKWKYCSPEHLGVLDKQERIDARADLYSFGIVLYEMLTGVAPFQATTPHGYLQMHASEMPPALRATNPSVTASSELEAIIFRALEKDREKRFASAREFARALHPLIADLDDTAGLRPRSRRVEIADALTIPVADLEMDQQERATVPVAEVLLSGREAERTMRISDLSGSDAATLRVISIDADRKRKRLLSVGAIAAGVVLALVLLIFTRGENQPTATTLAGAVTTPAQRAVVENARVGLYAYPWAEVKVIRNSNTGVDLPLSEPLLTPAPVELEPGRWELHFMHPDFSEPVVRLVQLGPGDDQLVSVQFKDATKATLPRFDGVIR
jgi:serine/threonine protein kinase